MIDRVRTEEAVGLTLAHDITKVIPGGTKGPAFRRGHVIRTEDIPEFLKMGKEHVYVLQLKDGDVHEEEAATRIARAVAGPGLDLSDPHEGRVDLIANQPGLLKIGVEAVDEINLLGDIILATIHNNTVCEKGMAVAGTRIIPLYIRDSKLVGLERVAERHRPVFAISPLKHRNIGLVITGNEVFKGVIRDGFSPVLHKKVEALGCKVNNQAFVPDDADVIAHTILDFQARGSEVVLCSSGMSVDPDDATPEGIRRTGAKIAFYGLPVLPGAMFLYAKLGQTHILGVPACVLHAPTTGLDLLLPRVLAGEELTFEETRKLGHGGLCLRCPECTYPVCPFGK